MTFERQLGGWSFITYEGAGHYGTLLGGHLTVIKVVFKEHLSVKESDVGTLIFQNAETT